jgi:hypothetical protein
MDQITQKREGGGERETSQSERRGRETDREFFV